MNEGAKLTLADFNADKAKALAAEGKNYKEILKFFYKDCDVLKEE